MITFKFVPAKVNAVAELHAVAPAATRAAADAILAASRPLVPVESGALRDSGQVTQEGTKARVSYDAIAPDGYPYGIRQHEDMSLHHPNGGQAKFLEQPMNSAHDTAFAAMLGEIARVLG